MIILEHWAPHELMIAAAPPAEVEPHVYLVGVCYGHPLKEDGAEVSTGKVLDVRIEGSQIIMKTLSGLEYELGAPAESYLSVFPDARAKIFAWWTKAHPNEQPLAEQPRVIHEPVWQPGWRAEKDINFLDLRLAA
jgi:hypothetical protein